MKNKVQIYINFPNYKQTNKFFVGTHYVRPKKNTEERYAIFLSKMHQGNKYIAIGITSAYHEPAIDYLS